MMLRSADAGTAGVLSDDVQVGDRTRLVAGREPSLGAQQD
jgi:hypothetical protein